mgnify:CR=1 FL=1
MKTAVIEVTAQKQNVTLNSHEQVVLDRIINDVKGLSNSKIKALQEVQAKYGYLKNEHMKYLAKKLNISFMELYSIATFYAQFKFNPIGRHIIRVCDGTACHVKGSVNVLKELKNLIHIGIDETTNDGRFTIMAVRCLGCCSLAPAVMVDDKTFGKVQTAKINKILSLFE